MANSPNPHTNGSANTTQVLAPSPPIAGLKARFARFPGIMILHRLIKNFRYWSNTRLKTIGGIKRGHMTIPKAAAYTESIFHKLDEVVRQHGSWDGLRVLEIGPGDSLGTGLWCLGAGAKSYTAIDRFAVELDQDFESQVFQAIFQKMAPSANSRCRKSLGNNIVPDPAVFQYKNDLPIEKAPELMGHACFDVIFSNAVLEHVQDLRGTLLAMWDLLAPGGIMFHDVDLRSHQTYETNPLQFLEYSSPFWKLMSSHNGEPNRVRMPQYRDILSGLGFSDIRMGIKQVFAANLVETRKDHLAKEFRNLTVEELTPAIFWFTCCRLK